MKKGNALNNQMLKVDTYKNPIGIIWITSWVWCVDGEGDAVGEDGRQDHILEWSGAQVKEFYHKTSSSKQRCCVPV